MSKLNELIEKLCPNGVEFKKLEELLTYEQPTKYIVKTTKYSDEYTIPVLTAGQSFILGYTNEDKGIFNASNKKPVIIFDDFTTSFHWVDFDFKVKSSAMKILKPINDNVNFKYIYYAMSTIKYIPGNHARHWISVYSQFSVPVPPLEVQREIVHILDDFTLLSAELSAELKARQKQYEYYRDKLLDFDNTANPCGCTHTHGYLLKNIKWLELKELFDTKNGYTPSKSNKEYWKNGTISWYRMEDIRENGRILSDSIQHVNAKGIKRKLFPKNSIIISTSATIGEHALITEDFLCNQRFTCLIIKDKYKDKYDVKFLFYYCYLLCKWCLNNLNKGNFASVDMKMFEKFKFPIIELREQKKIVYFLENLDKLCNDMAEGLPAEIEARQKQYEYYRDKLISFKELK